MLSPVVIYGGCLVVAVCILAYVLPKFRRMAFHPPDGDYRPFAFSFLIAAFVFVAVVFAAAVYIKYVGKDFGTFGDFFGGVANPILTFLTIVGLLITIVMQQDATREARRDNYRQMFDSTFFQMLTLLNTIVNELEIVDAGNSVAKGKYCFTYAYQKFRGLYNDGNTTNAEIQRIGAAWSSIYYPSTFPHYFRFVFNIVRTIDESTLDKKTKIEYVRLLRAQLSNDETAIIFYNCLTSYGEKFRVYIKTYKLTDNLPPHMYLSKKHPPMIDQPPFDMSTVVVGNF